jgi:hypothetical protein
MTPTSALGGVLTGAIDGAVIALLVFAAIYFGGRYRRAIQAVRAARTVRAAPPVREESSATDEYELPRAS